MSIARAGLLIACVAVAAGCREEARAAAGVGGKKLIVLGVDGLDPVLSEKLMREGRMPNLAAIAKQGGFLHLATVDPPQSPVAWSAFITGADSDVHGIYDFVHRDPVSRMPYLSTSKSEDPEVMHLGPLAIPLGSAKIELLRGGRAFWDVLADHGVPSMLFQIPANYPPLPSVLSKNTSGMGTPDLLGTYGTFQVLTTDPQLAKREVDSGIITRIAFEGVRAQAALRGPPNPLTRSKAPLEAPVEIFRAVESGSALVRIGGEEHLLVAGEWTGWIPITLDPAPLAPGLAGMVRLYLKSVEPFFLYASPINIDPTDPAQPIASVEGYVEAVGTEAGRFYTQGMPEDTKALEEGIFTPDEFLKQGRIIFGERGPLLDWHLKHFESGLLFFYFSSIDQTSHMFWSAMDEDAPPERAKYAGVIPDLYAEMDAVIGKVMKEKGADTELVVMSDHGFGTWKRKFHLNAWLAQNGYLTPRKGVKFKAGSWRHVDWARTRAYGIGINQLFLNLKGREPGGIVPEAEQDALRREIAEKLKAWRDPSTGEAAVTRVFLPPRGAYPDRTPDLIVGYNRDWRGSNESALGEVPAEIVEPNDARWDGDHCVDPAHVPGVLASTVRLSTTSASLMDLAPSILHFFGVEKTPEMRGRNVFADDHGS